MAAVCTSGRSFGTAYEFTFQSSIANLCKGHYWAFPAPQFGCADAPISSGAALVGTPGVTRDGTVGLESPGVTPGVSVPLESPAVTLGAPGTSRIAARHGWTPRPALHACRNARRHAGRFGRWFASSARDGRCGRRSPDTSDGVMGVVMGDPGVRVGRQAGGRGGGRGGVARRRGADGDACVTAVGWR